MWFFILEKLSSGFFNWNERYTHTTDEPLAQKSRLKNTMPKFDVFSRFWLINISKIVKFLQKLYQSGLKYAS